ncbi:TetR family transcriptional regulator [Peterkaempfera bronchialis]|uniref:TetR family transcriptional regulator n=1 Tax=Peterkaempfera bronchialis TaxID=2126346 RepID=A0A345SRF5_9ACTN|nr:TetR family transcriptional regulator [Peterkaempfera bronchialis]AXI76310.1 TetR family transcriptional regulator [Peterkaempfera bronchialis]
MAAQAKRTASPRRRRARGSITSEEILRGAFTLCEADGVDGLSMPRLAQHLDVGVTSIYWYFKSKEDLLDALTEEAFKRLYGQMPPLEGRTWEEVLREFFTNFRSILRTDDVLCDLSIMRGASYSDDTITLTWSRIEEILEVLVGAGFSEESASYAYFTLSVYTRGSLMVERMMRAHGLAEGTSSPRAHLASKMPIMSREVERHSWNMVSDDDFAFGVENNLRGLRALLAADRKAAKAGAASK